jgi:large subunit ribosomal protein L17
VRHRVHGRQLNADTQHRLAMRRNLARALFLHDRIVTTTAKAKYVRPFAEKLITRARKALAARDAGEKARWIHLVRLIARDVPDRKVLQRLLAEVAPRANRAGGYTRIMRDWKNQVGDNAPRSILELVDRPAPEEVPPEDAEAAAKGEKAGKAKKGGAAAAEKPAKAKKPAKGKAQPAGAEAGSA